MIFLAVNQFTIIENGNNRRPDIVLFVNGLSLVMIELKRPDEDNGFNDEEIAFLTLLLTTRVLSNSWVMRH